MLMPDLLREVPGTAPVPPPCLRGRETTVSPPQGVRASLALPLMARKQEDQLPVPRRLEMPEHIGRTEEEIVTGDRVTGEGSKCRPLPPLLVSPVQLVRPDPPLRSLRGPTTLTPPHRHALLQLRLQTSTLGPSAVSLTELIAWTTLRMT